MRQFKKILHIALACLFILIGVAGLVLPILDGVLFLLLGLILLSFESAYIESQLYKLTHKHDFIGNLYDKLNAWMRKIFT